MEPDFLASLALDNHWDEMSSFPNLGLVKSADLSVEDKSSSTYRINSIAARLIPSRYCLSLTYAPSTSSRRSRAVSTTC